jgi:hypothetical protein
MTVSIEVPEKEPLQVAAGDTWTWKRILSDFLPSDNWLLSYALVKDGNLIQISASDDNDSHLVEVSPSMTAVYNPGDYRWNAYVTNSVTSERYKIDSGVIKVLTNLAAQSTGYDGRSHAKKVLDALEAVILNKASKDQLSYSIGGRSISRLSPAELFEWRDKYRAEFNAEERRAGRKKPPRVEVRF